MSELLVNKARSTLGATIDADDTTLMVSSATDFPASGDFRIIVDDEIMLVTGVSGTTFTVTRGQEGSTADDHDSGAVVAAVITKEGLERFRNQYILSGTFASIPTAGIQGRIYLPSDEPFGQYDDGTKWNPLGPCLRKCSLPSAGSFSDLNLQSASFTSDRGYFYLSNTTAQHFNCKTITVPSAPYTLTAGYYPNFYRDPTNYAGLILADNTDKCIFLGHSFSTSNEVYTRASKFSTVTTSTVSAEYFTIAVYSRGSPYWTRIIDDGTNRKLQFSVDGVNFYEKHSIGNTDWITPTKIGFCVNASSGATGMALFHWEIG